MFKTPTSIFPVPGRAVLGAVAIVAALAVGTITFLATAGDAAASQIAATPLDAVQPQEATTAGGAYVHVPWKSRDNEDWYQFVLYENDSQVASYDVQPVLPKSSVQLIGDDAADGHTIACGGETANFKVFAWKHGPNGTSVKIRQVPDQLAPVRPCDNLHVDFVSMGGGADVRVSALETDGADWYRFTLRSPGGFSAHNYDIDARATRHYVTVGGPGSNYRLPCDGGPNQSVSSGGVRKANFFVTAWETVDGARVKLRDVGYQLSPVHACPPPEPQIGPFSESVDGPYVVAVVADAGYTESEGDFVRWNVPMTAVAGQTGPLDYDDLIKTNAFKAMEFPARSDGDLLDWGVLDGYVARVNLSELVDDDVDLSDPDVCHSYRVAYKAQGLYSTSSGPSWDNTKIESGGYEAEIFGCGSAREASADEARVMVPFVPLDAVPPAFVSYTHFTVDLQRVDANGNLIGPVYRSGDYGRRTPDGTRMSEFGSWWMAFAVPYDGNALGVSYSDCYEVKLKARVVMHYGDVSDGAAADIDDVLAVENCWRAPLAPTKLDLTFPVEINWDPVVGADGYVLEVIDNAAAGAVSPIAPWLTATTIYACSPSGDDNVMRVEVHPYVIPLDGSFGDRVEWPGAEFALPCPAQ